MSRTLPLLLTLLAAPALAQREPPDLKPVPDDDGPPRVYAAHTYDDEDWYRASLGDRISLHIKNFGQLLKETNNVCSRMVLYMDGQPIRGLEPDSCDPLQGHLRYRIRRTEKSNDTWNVLLGHPRSYSRKMGISVGTNDQFSIASDVTDFELIAVRPGPLLSYATFAFLWLVITVWLSIKTGVIRVRGGSANVQERPFSLALFQMVFWFFLVINSYVFIWLITGDLDSITDSVLALLGVGVGTALGSTMIEGSAKGKPSEREAGPAAPPVKSHGFFRDLLEEDGTVSLPKFQLFLWTLTLGVIFCWSVYDTLQMPQFSVTLLALMGISSGTYLGFKTQKPAAPVLSPAPQPAEPVESPPPAPKP